MTRASIGAALSVLVLLNGISFEPAQAHPGGAGGASRGGHPGSARSATTGFHRIARPAAAERSHRRFSGYNRQIGPGGFGAWPYGYGYLGTPASLYDEAGIPLDATGGPPYPGPGFGVPDPAALYQARALGLFPRPRGCQSQEQLVPGSGGMVRVVVTRC
jgi:hypothetical protein